MYFSSVFSRNPEYFGTVSLIKRGLILQEKTNSSQCTKQKVEKDIADAKRIRFHGNPLRK
jgi:hypothetical protein